MYSLLEILGVTLTPVLTLVVLLAKKLNFCKLCCCKSECTKTDREIDRERYIDEHIRSIALEEVVKHSPSMGNRVTEI